MENNQLSVDEMITGLSEKLNEYGYDKRLSNADLAAHCKVSYPMIREIQDKKVGNIGLKKLIDVANAIGLRVDIKFSKLK